MTARFRLRKPRFGVGEEPFGLAGLEVNHNRFPVQAAAVAEQRSVDEDCVRRPQRAIPSVDVTEHMEPWPGLEDRFQKLGTAFPTLRAWTVVKDGKGRSVRNQDGGILRDACPVLLPVFRTRLAKCSAVKRRDRRPPNLQALSTLPDYVG